MRTLRTVVTVPYLLPRVRTVKANQSLRSPSGKSVGGQQGREGKTLEMTATPDKIVELKPDYCSSCGASLQDKIATKEQSRFISA